MLNYVSYNDRLWYTMALRGQIACRFYKGYSMKLNRRAWPIGVGKRWLSTSPHAGLLRVEVRRMDIWTWYETWYHGEQTSRWRHVHYQLSMSCKLQTVSRFPRWKQKKLTKRYIEMPLDSLPTKITITAKTPGAWPPRCFWSCRMRKLSRRASRPRVAARRQMPNSKQRSCGNGARCEMVEGWGVEVGVSKYTICPA